MSVVGEGALVILPVPCLGMFLDIPPDILTLEWTWDDAYPLPRRDLVPERTRKDMGSMIPTHLPTPEQNDRRL